MISQLGALLDRITWPVAVMMALFLGLAPFMPEPHVWEKLKMLGAGDLTRAIDMFDLLLHGAPWLLLGAKVIRTFGFQRPAA